MNKLPGSMSKNRDRLKSNVIKGFGTLIVREFFIKLLSFGGQIFLARLLIPSDFGIYAIVAFLITSLNLFTDVGISLAIIQRHKMLSHKELSSAFFLKLLLSLSVIVFIWIFAPYLKFYYSTFSDENILMVRVLSLIFIANCFRLIPMSLLERKINYNAISLVDILGIVVYYVVSLIGAYLHHGAWSLILGILAKEFIEVTILCFVKPFIPQLSFSKSNIKKMIKFGIYLQGTAIVNIINSSIAPIIGGKTKGIYAVGLLDFAYNIASLPEVLAVNFGRVAFAGYSRIQKQKKLLTISIIKSMSMLAIILYFFPLIIFGLGKEIVPFVFSAKWEAALPALYWYSAGTIFLPIISSMGQGILVIGKSKDIFWTSITTSIIGWFSAFILVKFLGFAGIAAAYFFITLFFTLFYYLIFRRANYKFPIIKIIYPKLLVMVISLFIVYFMNSIFQSTITFLILKIFLTIVVE